MSSIKLTADSGGGTVELKAPSSTTGNAAKQIIVPQEGFGKIIQVVYEQHMGNYTTTSTSYQHASGFDTTITPKASNSTLIISWVGSTNRAYAWNSQEAFARFALTKDNGSNWLFENYHRYKTWNNDGILGDTTHAFQYMESAGSTSARTYELWYKRVEGDAIEISPDNNNNASSMMIMEVEA